MIVDSKNYSARIVSR